MDVLGVVLMVAFWTVVVTATVYCFYLILGLDAGDQAEPKERSRG